MLKVLLPALAFALTLAVLVASARAAEERPRLTVEDVIQITNGLAQLGGYDKVAKDGETEKVYRKPYSFGGGTAMTIALDIAAGRRITSAYSIARESLIAQFANGGTTVPPENLIKFNEADRKALDLPADVTFGRINKADLKLDENPIPVSVLSLILKILD